ncbi:class I adenylate-forming enzyme family protein [Halomarina litorea]|uniref:class I adenylate-forming enzyme family protein n=1 Tax=Halomarina litorea TaxID=2961595 RepID=UPI0020C4C887|nr:AMP-binding protein [Halomarina sp. BCD28]
MEQGFDTDTIRWRDGVVGHDPEAFPELETVERDGYSVRAYADRPTGEDGPAGVDGLLARAVEREPDREAVVFPESGERWTYATLDERVDRVAAGLASAGVGAGDLVTLVCSNGPAFVEAFFAAVRVGAVAAPVNTRVSPRELDFLLTTADPACLVGDGDLADTVREAGVPDGTPVFVTDGEETGEERPYADLPAAGDPPRPTTDETDPTAVLYTSGTTGHPKGCVIDGFHLANGAHNYRTSFATGDGLRSMVTVPLFHVAGLVANLLHTIVSRGTTVILDGASPETFLGTIETERVEFVLDVPTNYTLAMARGDPSAYDLDSWAVAAYGGAPMPAESVRRLRESFPDVALCDAYGTTETVGGLVTMCPDEYTDERASTIGLPTPPMELAVVDDDRIPLGPGETGELAIRGPIVVESYLDRPEATAESFEDGWYYTGDLATIDGDGFVELRGRGRDKIVRGGENVYALDVEEVLVAHAGVLEASVTSFPDEVLGERVLGAVVPREGVRLTEDDLREHCAGRLADYKIPEVFRILDELPKNPGGKVVKSDLLPEPLRHGIRAGGGE